MYVASTATCWQKKHSLSAGRYSICFSVTFFFCFRFSKDLLYIKTGKQAIRVEERERKGVMATKRIRERETEWEERSEDDKRTRQQHQSRSEETRLGNNIKALNEGQQRRRQELEWQQRHMQACVCVCVCVLVHSCIQVFIHKSQLSYWCVSLRHRLASHSMWWVFCLCAQALR